MYKFRLHIILITFTSLLFSDIPNNFERYKIKQSLLNTSSQNYNKNTYPGKAMLYSAVIPGLGQLYNGNIKKALLFTAVEISAISIYFSFNDKSANQEKKYKQFADQEWDFFRWMRHYYDWRDDEVFGAYFSNIQNLDNPVYYDIWDGSHHLEFQMTGNDGNIITLSTTDAQNESIFRDTFFSQNGFVGTPDTSRIIELENDENFILLKDSHYYENIFKYNHFFAGWEDYESIQEESNEGYLIAKSPKKWKYRSMRDQVAKFERVASYATSVILFNHIFSIIDAAWIKTDKHNKYKIEARPLFNKNNKLGVGGFTIYFKW